MIHFHIPKTLDSQKREYKINLKLNKHKYKMGVL